MKRRQTSSLRRFSCQPTHSSKRQSATATTGGASATSSAVDAVFCCNDLIAVGLLKRFQELGFRVPDDVAVVGWDDTEDALYTTPTLTSIAPDKQAIADAAIAGALRSTATSSQASASPIGFELIVRGSTSS
ncbi:substrate-binding domain-containing protein [Curtobacterium flaccumfaciens]|uniref:substrate-binding domain-containing protein n=1 Tax=Curtobacterium flaccumfaciens TaxID=2035 RepID=UPI00203314E4|nr:substrate-binding domain-containing protein [Curtobacterium flaccumfaciens]